MLPVMTNPDIDNDFGEMTSVLLSRQDDMADMLRESQQVLGLTSRRRKLSQHPQYIQGLANTTRFLAEVFSQRRGSDLLREAIRRPAMTRWILEAQALRADLIYRGFPIRSVSASDSNGAPTYVAEAMSVTDFPNLFGDTLNRRLLDQYQAQAISWPNYFYRNDQVKDFRKVRPIALDGLTERWTNYQAAEYAPPHVNDNLVETPYEYAVAKFRRGFTLSWEMFVNDDLGAFRDLPSRLSLGARRTEEYLATSLFCDAAGPNATLYSVAHKNLVTIANGSLTDNPALSIVGLQDAMTVLGNMVDAQGEPIMMDMMELVVPPALEVTANNILHAEQLWLVPDSTADGQRLATINWMRGRVRLSVNAYIPQIITTGTKGNTSWFLFASPNNGRPAGELGFLTGMSAPSLFQKAPNMMAVGGGIEDMMGDYDTMGLEYSGLHVVGGTALDYRATLASFGQ